MYSSSEPDLSSLGAAAGTYFACVSIFALLVVAFMLWMYWRIFKKAGYSGAWTFLNLLPGGSLILILMLAFGNWPVLRAQQAQQQGYGYPGQPYAPPAPGYAPPQPQVAQPAPAYQPPVQQPVPPAYQPPVAPAPQPAPPAYQPPVAPAPQPAPPAYQPPPAAEPPAPQPPVPPAGQ
jgi:hypothetical protein